MSLPMGSVVIRDKRTWHRGTENKSGKVVEIDSGVENMVEIQVPPQNADAVKTTTTPRTVTRWHRTIL